MRIALGARDLGEYSNEEFACDFLDWLVATYPPFAGKWVCVPDLKDDLLPNFQVFWECPGLQFGALARGLAKVTKKREKYYTDDTGRRRSITEYLVPKDGSGTAYLVPKADVVKLPVRKRA